MRALWALDLGQPRHAKAAAKGATHMGISKTLDGGIVVDDLRSIYVLLNRRMLLAALEALHSTPESPPALVRRFVEMAEGLKEIGAVVGMVADAVNGAAARPLENIRQSIDYLRGRVDEAEARLRVLGVTVNYGDERSRGAR